MNSILAKLFAASAALALGSASVLADGSGLSAAIYSTNGSAGDEFGRAVDVHGSMAIVGRLRTSISGSLSGAAYLFDVNTRLQFAELRPTVANFNDAFGYSVAIHGARAIVGAPRDSTNGLSVGAAYIFDTNDGSKLAKLIPDDFSTFTRFGRSVEIDGNLAVVGAAGGSINGVSTGVVYLFDLASGAQVGKLFASDASLGDFFGHSLALDHGVLLVGAPFDDDNGFTSGSAYLFDLTTRSQVAKLLATDGAMDDQFGFSVGLSGGLALVGAQQDNDNGTQSGAAYLFDSSTGTQLAKLLPSNGASFDRFGSSVAISRTTVLVGAPMHAGNGTNSGSTYVFDAAAAAEETEFLWRNGTADDLMGSAVAIDGTTALIGAPRDDGTGVTTGAAYIYFPAIQAGNISRNGSGINALRLTGASAPVLGGQWASDLDCSGHTPALAILELYSGASRGLVLRGGEVLVDLSSPFLTRVLSAHNGGNVQFSLPVPNDPALCGLAASAQGIVLGAPGYELSNALDLTVGL